MPRHHTLGLATFLPGWFRKGAEPALVLLVREPIRDLLTCSAVFDCIRIVCVVGCEVHAYHHGDQRDRRDMKCTETARAPESEIVETPERTIIARAAASSVKRMSRFSRSRMM